MCRLCYNRQYVKIFRTRHPDAFRGYSEAHRRRNGSVAMAKRDFLGAKNPNWRGGTTSHPLYLIYKEMLARCTRKSHKSYSYYGGRGITVCQRWLDNFWAFVGDMGPRPEGRIDNRPAYVLDRIDNDGNYEPSNLQMGRYCHIVAQP